MDGAPDVFDHTVPVPGLVSLATPPFEQVGVASAKREAFWFQRTFMAPAKREVALLELLRTRFGVRVWVNGVDVGQHLGVFTRARFDVSDAIEWGAENTVTVRVGALRESLPAGEPAGQDFEADRWIPGIWDDVRLVTADNPTIEQVQLLPDSATGDIRAITVLKNRGTEPVVATLVTGDASAQVTVAAGASETVEQVAHVDGHQLWSPESPVLHTVAQAVSVAGKVVDSLDTRVGFRTVEWRRRAGDEPPGFFLNGERRWLLGTNITLHRFFEDPVSAGLPWDRVWVRGLLEKARDMGWQTIRITVGRAPEFWYDLADELGLLLADEFAIWTFIDDSADDWTVDALVREFTAWIIEARNHPSIAWWDAANETPDPRPNQVIDAVRHLDPTRQWENGGFTEPHGDADPIEDHPYLFSYFPSSPDSLSIMDGNDGQPPQGGVPTVKVLTWDDAQHPYILNEYGWLWINRDGTPTTLTELLWGKLLPPGPHAADVYREAYAYGLRGMTNFWRTHRGYAAILHFPFLGYSRVEGETSDSFIDLPNLTLEPRFEAAMRHAFAPVGVYLQSWQESWPAGEQTSFTVRAVNDSTSAQEVQVRLKALAQGTGEVLTEGVPSRRRSQPASSGWAS